MLVIGGAGDEPTRLTSSVDAVRTLELRTISNGSPQSDDRWLLLLLARLSNRIVYASEVTTNPSIWGPQRSKTTYWSPSSTWRTCQP